MFDLPNLVFNEIHNWDVKENFTWQEDSKYSTQWLVNR